MVENIVKTTKYKLILILGQLSSSEWRALKKFILMYTRERSDNFDLFTLLRKEIDKLNTNDDVQRLHLEYFSQMTAKTFFNMMSRLTKWVEDWLVYEDMRKSDDRDIRLIRLYNSRGLYKESNAVAKKAIKTATTKPGLSLMATKNLAQIYYYQYYSDNPIKHDTNRNLFENLINTTLEYYCNSSNLLNIQFYFTQKQHDKNLNKQNELLEIITTKFPRNELTDLFTDLKNLVKLYDFQSLIKIKNTLESNSVAKNSDLHIITMMYSFNSTMSLWSKNKFQDSKIIEEVVNYSIKSGLLTKDGKIESNMWNNLVSIISSTRNYQESIAFIEKWHQIVSIQDIPSLKSLSLAQACFHQGKFEEIRDHVQKMKKVHHSQKYRTNSLVVISLFKDRKQNYKIFIDFANNFIRQLERTKNKDKNTNYIAYKNLVLTLISIAKSDYSGSKTIIEDSRHIMYRNWLRKEIKKASTKF